MNYLLDHLFTRSIGNPALLFVIVLNVRSQSCQKLIQRTRCRFSLTEVGIFSVVLNLDIIAESLVVFMHFKEQVGSELRRVHAIERSDSLVAPLVSDALERSQVHDGLELDHVLRVT